MTTILPQKRYIMEIYQTLILALIQGITEFLPISSSAHLVLTRQLLGWQEAGVAFDAFTGLGTLSAVLIYFRHDLKNLTTAWLQQFKTQPTPHARLANQLIIATLPTLLFAYLLLPHIDTLLHNPLIIAATTIIFALFLALSDIFGKKNKTIEQTSYKHALLYGLMQSLALIPGVSRSGITLTLGLSLGYTRTAAARFSFLLSIPISAIAGFYGLIKLLEQGTQHLNHETLLLAYLVSFSSGYLCIALFLKFINLIGMWPHVIYRLLLGTFILYYFL